MQEHNDEMTEGNDEGVERAENENYAFFMESTTIEYVTERHCSLASVGVPLDDKGYAIAMKKSCLYFLFILKLCVLLQILPIATT